MTYSPKLDHAVIIGGSIAGMTAARVLAKYYRRVTIVDRDALPVDTPRARRGIPQSTQPHGLQVRGRRELEQAFPGFHDEVLRAGGHAFDLRAEMARYTPWGWHPSEPCGLLALSASRPLYETVCRRSLRAQCTNLEWVEGAKVTGFRSERTDAGPRVTGIFTDGGEGAPREIEADVVVDASGRGTRTPKWLEQLGLPRLRKRVVDSHGNYATRHYRMPPEAKTWWWKVMMIDAITPDVPQACSIFPVENDTWIVTALGMDRNYAPSETGAWLEFVRNLRSPAVAQVLRCATPLTDVMQTRTASNVWREIHRYPLVPGLVMTGDAVCGFNPLYGQGVTAAAISATYLEEQLARHGALGLQAVKGFYKKQAALLEEGWNMSVSFDFRWNGTEGKRPLLSGLVRYLANLMVHVTTLDPVVFTTAAPLADFGASRWGILAPHIVARIWFQMARIALTRPKLPAAEEIDVFDRRPEPLALLEPDWARR